MSLTLALSPEGIIKGQPPNITMFGIKLKVLSTLILNWFSLTSSPDAPHKVVIKDQRLNIAIFSINLKVLPRTLTFNDLA